MKNVLLIAGAGAIGSYTAEELVARGFDVDIITLDCLENKPHIRYINERATVAFYRTLLSEKTYDAIVDFMDYDSARYEEVLHLLASHTEQLIYLSSYRVYGDAEHPVRETSPKQDTMFPPDSRIFEVDTYPINKIRCERIIRNSPYADKVTIVRPVISFYRKNLSFITTKFYTLIERSRAGKPILVPEITKTVAAGYSFSGNVGKLLAHLVLNPKAYGEAFTLSAGEQKTWGEIAEYFSETLGAEFVWVDTESYLQYGAPALERERYGLLYDRALDRDVDVSKVMEVTGLTSADFVTIESAIRQIVTELPDDMSAFDSTGMLQEIDDKMDQFLQRVGR